MKKKNLAFNIFFGLIAVAAIVIATRYFFHLSTREMSDDAQVQQLLSPVNARVGGYIREIRFTEFQQVHKGDTLVIIDPGDYLVQRSLAEAGLLDAQAGKSVAQSTVSTVQSNLSISDANIGEIRARLWNAEKNLQRYEILLKQESITQQQYDQAASDYESLKARLLSLENVKTASSRSVTEASNRVSVNEANIKRAEANLEMANLNLSYTVILAPCDGTIGRKTIIVGQLVQQGQPIVSVVDDKQKWVTVNFREKQMPQVQVGKKVRIHIDAFPDKEFSGQVQSIATATGAVFSMVPTDNATGNFVKVQQRIPVRVEFTADNDKALLSQLRAGMNAVVTISK
ncbi:HlyD family secretion protein [Chitinophaga sancti]|uniref:HlyD family secretion protein n=1 Tax=Chitinophaga sancti TaxID=1004 RepID=A0A1K1SVD7_9BACT|nr:HlyD family secretion protein [Chitinophaga sancti]WQD63813.1 HlyD family secretion protein [Chitinophaga sancti]WQG90562.1 HlyD family secretion protein [Chitinophaga sancti]SFW88204.1 membrane fusion protein, multidrug efflux system [Chitinophaga sancti]